MHLNGKKTRNKLEKLQSPRMWFLREVRNVNHHRYVLKFFTPICEESTKVVMGKSSLTYKDRVNIKMLHMHVSKHTQN